MSKSNDQLEAEVKQLRSDLEKLRAEFEQSLRHARIIETENPGTLAKFVAQQLAPLIKRIEALEKKNAG